MEKKYTVLRVIATLYKILGVLIALGTVLAVILVLFGSMAFTRVIQQSYDYDPGNLGGLGVVFAVVFLFISGGLAALGVYAVGEAIYLLIGLEENTRFTAVLLRDRFFAPAQPAQPVMPPPPYNPGYPPAA